MAPTVIHADTVDIERCYATLYSPFGHSLLSTSHFMVPSGQNNLCMPDIFLAVFCRYVQASRICCIVITNNILLSDCFQRFALYTKLKGKVFS